MKKSASKTKQKVSEVFNQAKESLKLFETLERETIKKAKKLMHIPPAAERRKLTNDKILAGLKKVGVATQDELNSLLLRIEKLEAAVATQMDNEIPRKLKVKSGADTLPHS